MCSICGNPELLRDIDVLDILCKLCGIFNHVIGLYLTPTCLDSLPELIDLVLPDLKVATYLIEENHRYILARVLRKSRSPETSALPLL